MSHVRHIQELVRKQYNRKSAIVVWTAISASVLLGFTALAVDLGYLKVVKAELQNAADASALAGVSGLFTVEGQLGFVTQDELVALAKSRAGDFCTRNSAAGKALYLDSGSFAAGYLEHLKNLTETMSTTSTPFNAVRVTVKKELGSVNGPVDLFFAAIWGKQKSSAFAEAMAAIDDRVVGYRVKEKGSALLPVTVRQEKWQQDIVNKQGEDCYGYDPVTGAVTEGPDGIPELTIYPEKQKDMNSPDGAGNLGLLNFENGNAGNPTLENQILNGLSEADLMGTIGSPEIRFIGSDGQSISHNIVGTPGLKTVLLQEGQAFRYRLGDVIGYFVHSQVVQSGMTATYNIVNIQYGRLLQIEPKASIGSKAVVIQPVTYTGDEIITEEYGPHHLSGGRIVLVR